MFNEMSISSNDLNPTCKLLLFESNDHKSFIYNNKFQFHMTLLKNNLFATPVSLEVNKYSV